MKSLPWELCTVTMAQLTWVSYRLSLMTPSQGTIMGLHQAVQPPRSRVRGQTKQTRVFKSHLPVVVQALHLPPPEPHLPSFSINSSSVFHVTAPGSWDHGPTEEQTKAGRHGQGLCLLKYLGTRGTGYSNPGPRGVTANLGQPAFRLSPEYFRCCWSCFK